jgi:FkbM family methyltransferase
MTDLAADGDPEIKSRVAEQLTKLKDIFWHINWLRDLIQNAGDNEQCQFLDFCRINLAQSKAQAFQDLFVLYTLDHKRDGYFVEFGATDGFNMSNTHLLEKHYGWKGILAEPAKIWHRRLTSNRECDIDFRCVFEEGGKLIPFNEVGTGEISTIADFSNIDGLGTHRKAGTVYNVETVSLNELLRDYDAPRHIDYLSLDTEGSEYAILKNFNFDHYKFEVITVEHNFIEEQRQKLFELLTSKGYVRKFEVFSAFEDWYVKAY